jgi:hypothetical protein
MEAPNLMVSERNTQTQEEAPYDTKRQFWSYCGLAVATRFSGEYSDSDTTEWRLQFECHSGWYILLCVSDPVASDRLFCDVESSQVN